MKKTLVALAALAATGAFAQVTVTGEFAYGYQTKTTGGATQSDAAGFGVDTSEIDFAATEDLGGGWKATAKLAMGGLDRSGESGNVGVTAGGNTNGSVTGRNAVLQLTTPVGMLEMGTKRNADYLGQGVAGVANIWYGFDGDVTAGRSKRDQVSFVAPLTSAFTLAASHQEETSTKAGNPLNGLGQGEAGDAGTTGQRVNILGLTYKTGPVVIDGQYLVFDSKSTTASLDNQYRLSGSYDAGVVKLGLGVTKATVVNAGTNTDTLFNIAAPFGAFTLGAAWAQNRVADTNGLATEGTRSGYALQGTYNLSKQTYMIAAYKRFDKAIGDANATTQTNLLLVKDF